MTSSTTSMTRGGGIEELPSRASLEKDEELLKRELVVFGKDLGSIPCFRNSFLYGITGGFGTGILTFALSSKVPTATKVGFYSYVGITLLYWIHCRYHYSLTKFKYTQLQYALKESVMKEGTADEMPKNP